MSVKPLFPDSGRDRVRIALIDGKEVPFEACATAGSDVDESIPIYKEYIGTGEIFSIDGIRQQGGVLYDFYKSPAQ